jgi:plastocyanin
VHNGDVLDFVWNPDSVDPEHTVTFLTPGAARINGFLADEPGEPPLTVINPTCNATCGTLNPLVFNPSNLSTTPPYDVTCGTMANPCPYDGAMFLHSGMQFDPGFEFVVKINVQVTNGPVTLDFTDLTHPNQIGAITVLPDWDNRTSTQQQVLNKATKQYQEDTAIALAAEAAATKTSVPNPDGTHTHTIWAGPGTFFTEVSEMLPYDAAGMPKVTIKKGDTVTWHTTVIQDVHTVTFPEGPSAEKIDPLQHRCETFNPPHATVTDATGDFIAETGSPSDCVNPFDYETHLVTTPFLPNPACGTPAAPCIGSPDTFASSGQISKGFAAFPPRYSYKFPNAGTYTYQCRIHDHMTGEIEVLP